MMATHSYKHATTRLGRVTQIFVQPDTGASSVSILLGHRTKRQVDETVEKINARRNPSGAF